MHWASHESNLLTSALSNHYEHCNIIANNTRSMLMPCIINSSPPSAAYMHQWIGSALLQKMACRLFGAKPLSKPMLDYCRLGPKEQTSVKFIQNIKLFIHENASENIVCEMAAVLSSGDEFKRYTHRLSCLSRSALKTRQTLNALCALLTRASVLTGWPLKRQGWLYHSGLLWRGLGRFYSKTCLAVLLIRSNRGALIFLSLICAWISG